jgi:hypothetical protein
MMSENSTNSKEIKITEREWDNAPKSVGYPNYDNEAQSVRGKTVLFEKLKENSDIINDLKPAKN